MGRPRGLAVVLLVMVGLAGCAEKASDAPGEGGILALTALATPMASCTGRPAGLLKATEKSAGE
mgnify:CR=1 FL=1